MSSFFLITRPLESSSYSYINTEIFGDVEIRHANNDLDIEKTRLKSTESNSFIKNINISDYDFSNRMSTIVESENETEAIRLANDKFVAVLDLKANELSLANVNLSKVGIIRNLSTGSIKPFIIRGIFKSGVFIRNISDLQRWGITNFILEKTKNPNNREDLPERYIKSIHWSHNANDEENKQLKLIFNYFCLEALFKENENDNISGIVRCFLGFPGGKYFNDVDKNIINTLKNNDDYSSLIKEIPIHLDEIRKFRNNSVHAGFRFIDINSEKLKLYEKILTLAKSRCLNAVLHAIIHDRIEVLSEFKGKVGDIFNKVADIEDILGNIVFSLKKGYDHDIIVIE